MAKTKGSPEQEARYAIDHGIPRSELSMGAQLVYDQLTAGQEITYSDADPLAGIEQRSSPEARARILAMFKNANGKYAKPFSKDRLAWTSVFGGNWEEYGQIVLQMAILDTLLSIEEKLDRLASSESGEDQDLPTF